MFLLTFSSLYFEKEINTFTLKTFLHTEKKYSLNLLFFFKVNGCNQLILATFK